MTSPLWRSSLCRPEIHDVPPPTSCGERQSGLGNKGDVGWEHVSDGLFRKIGPSAEDFASASQEGFWAGLDRWGLFHVKHRPIARQQMPRTEAFSTECRYAVGTGPDTERPVEGSDSQRLSAPTPSAAARAARACPLASAPTPPTLGAVHPSGLWSTPSSGGPSSLGGSETMSQPPTRRSGAAHSATTAGAPNERAATPSKAALYKGSRPKISARWCTTLTRCWRAQATTARSRNWARRSLASRSTIVASGHAPATTRPGRPPPDPRSSMRGLCPSVSIRASATNPSAWRR